MGVAVHTGNSGRVGKRVILFGGTIDSGVVGVNDSVRRPFIASNGY